MPLTFTPDETEERRRKSAAALAAGGQQAIGYGMDALSTMEALAKQKRAEERQAGLDERSAWQSDREFLRLQQKDTADRTRQTEQDRIAAEDRTLKLERQKAEDERAAEDRTLTLQANRDKTAQADLPRVAASLVDGSREVDSELLDDLARSNGLDRAALEAAYRAEIRARGEKRAAADLEKRKTESEIAENEAQAARARRVPTGADKPKPRAMSDSGVAKVAGIDSQIATLEDLVTRKPGVNVGPIDNVINNAAQMLGVDDPETTGFRAEVSGVIDQIISDLSGASVPAAEWDRLKAGLPNRMDNDSAFETKLRVTLERLRRIRQNLGQGYEASGRTMPGGAVPHEDNGTAEADAYFGG